MTGRLPAMALQGSYESAREGSHDDIQGNDPPPCGESKKVNWTKGSRGATAIEYALIIMNVALVIIAGVGSFGAAVANLYMRIVESIF